MGRTLVVTNDFPTRRGGIEAFVLALCELLPPDEVVVYTASMPGDAAFDSRLPFEVVRDQASRLLPTPRVRHATGQLLRSRRCDSVLFGASAPLGLLAPSLRRAGARRLIGLTHGHETWWARAPATRSLMRRIGERCDTLTYVSTWCRDRIAPALTSSAASRMRRLVPGVDTDRFAPGCGGPALRASLGIDGADPVVVCAARMVARKGQDTLVRTWPRVVGELPRARLLLAGDGPHRGVVEQMVDDLRIRGSVVLTGGVPWEEMPAYLDAGDVFAMPCRTRRAGLEPEALGIVFLEAQACGLPVIVGDSGGAPETVEVGQTGFVVDPNDHAAIANCLLELLMHPSRVHAMGERGRSWIRRAWTWQVTGARLSALLAGRDPDVGQV
jgi:phosphatidylinositol alpha-1,6-mannosyltransferase